MNELSPSEALYYFSDPIYYVHSPYRPIDSLGVTLGTSSREVTVRCPCALLAGRNPHAISSWVSAS